MIGGDQAFRGREIFVGPLIQIAPDAERTLHRDQHAIRDRSRTLIEPVWRIRDPRHHHLRRIGPCKAVLLRQPIQRVGIVGWPDLVGVVKNSEIDPAASTGAALNLDTRVLCA